MVKRLFNPLLVSVEYALRQYLPGDCLSGTVWLVNDQAQEVHGGDVEVVLWDGKGRPVERLTESVELEAHSVVSASSFRWKLPPGGDWRLTCRLAQGGRALSNNEYDLSAYDSLGPTSGQRLWAWLAGLVTPA